MPEVERCTAFTARDRLRAMLSPPILVLVPIYGCGLIPATALLAGLACRLDRLLGLPSLAAWLPLPLRLAAFVAALGIGGGFVAWTYTYLVLEGGGGPVPPFSERTRYLVTNGPYAVVRHPSIWGKLLGVVGLGILVGSPVFLFGMVPLLLKWSLESNMKRQDADMEAVFGDAFRRWAERTPRFVPRFVRGPA